MSNKKQVAILCGGDSYEHEVSIITGIQVFETIDTSLYEPTLVYVDTKNTFWHLVNFKNKKDFYTCRRVPVNIVQADRGAALMTKGWLPKVTAIDIFYLAFHGGFGESGGIQGMLDVYKAAYTSASLEGAVTAMNKTLTKEVLHHAGVPVLPWVSVFAHEYTNHKKDILDKITATLSFPLIIKPVHLGSSIGISIVKEVIALEKQLTIACELDTEILVEPALKEFTEYNVSVRQGQSGVVLSPIEEPVRTHDMLTFGDKYDNGAKKQGGGMQNLDRHLPAQIPQKLQQEIERAATLVYRATRLDGLVRIDFMYADSTLYCTEINPIPGSMAFYLWEAGGEQFTSQITQALEWAEAQSKRKVARVPYQTDIVKKFIGS